MAEAFSAYADNVREGAFPGPEETYRLKPEVANALREEIEAGAGRA
jgi:hypothetical protein